jgi:hypothetical protein
MPRWHIICQWNRQAARLIRNKYSVVRPRGLTSGSTRWLMSRAVGHVVAPGLRLGGEQKRTRYGPDTCRLRTPAWSWLRSGYSLSQNLGTLCEWPGPHTEGFGTHPRGPVRARGGPGPYLGVRFVYTGVRSFPLGARAHCWSLGSYRLLWPHGGPGAIHVVGSGAVLHATRASGAGTVPSHCSKGYPCSRVLTNTFQEQEIASNNNLHQLEKER